MTLLWSRGTFSRAVARCAGEIHPTLARYFFAIRELLDVTIRNLVGDFHELDINRKTQLEQFELFMRRLSEFKELVSKGEDATPMPR